MGWQLRSLEPGDVDWITEACGDAETQRWTLVPRPYTRAHAESFVADRGGEHSVWAIVADGEDRGSGTIGIHSIDVATGDADAGYWVAPWARRLGAATFAIEDLVRRAAAIDGVRAVTLQIAETNVASRGAAEKAGFVNAGPNGATCPDGCDAVTTLVYRRSLV